MLGSIPGFFVFAQVMKPYEHYNACYAPDAVSKGIHIILRSPCYKMPLYVFYQPAKEDGNSKQDQKETQITRGHRAQPEKAEYAKKYHMGPFVRQRYLHVGQLIAGQKA